MSKAHRIKGEYSVSEVYLKSVLKLTPANSTV